jgi:hypothetical protein
VPHTSDETLETAQLLLEQMRKEFVVVQRKLLDRGGFVLVIAAQQLRWSTLNRTLGSCNIEISIRLMAARAAPPKAMEPAGQDLWAPFGRE